MLVHGEKMNEKNIVVIGTLDTKGDQILFLKHRIEELGHNAVVIDLSMRGKSSFEASITPKEIALAGGSSIDKLRASSDRPAITKIMEAGATEIIKQLCSSSKINGIIALGGISMALMGSHIMKVVPFGIPKVIICPAAMPAYVTQFFDAMDIAIMQSIVELTGLNELVKDMIQRAAGSICGMVNEVTSADLLGSSKKCVAITQLGFCENCAKSVRKGLEEKGYTVYPFHAQGISDRAMDSLIEQGHFDGVIDIAPAGVIEEIFDGNRAAGPERLDAPIERGIPLVLAPSTINITGAGPTRRHSEKYASRKRILKTDSLRAGTRYNVDELEIGARAYAEKLNKAKGPVSFLFPLRGWSSIDKPGTVLYDPAEDKVFFDELRKNIETNIDIEEVDCNLDEDQFALALIEKFDVLYKSI
ncbi:MAG: Tm-1-like ATP-binding domain-containing protein [Deltaproteobacteria bacterium]|nr:Tm-1-like ATP-binding domain-containing protein [Deltaproteobacteria bacterium]